MALLLFIAALVDMPQHLVDVGGVSSMGMLTVAQLALAVGGLIAVGAYPKPLVHRMIPYGLFMGWVGLSVFWAPPQTAGVQNGVVYALFGVALLLSGTLAASEPRRMYEVIRRGVGWIDRITLTTIVVGLVTLGLPMADETRWFVGARSVAILALLPLSWHLAHWSQVPRAGVKAWLWLSAILLSLSRTALAAGLLCVLLATLARLRFSPRAFAVRVPVVLVTLAVVGALFTYVTPLRNRLTTGDVGFEVGGVDINVSGRARMWAVVTESATTSPVIGQGLGSSQRAVVDELDDIDHPHNDYLRLWHDLGAIGLLLFVGSLTMWLGMLCARWTSAERRADPLAPMKLAATLSLLGLLIVAITDNAIIYPFVMGPLGVMVGAGLGAPVTGAAVPGASTFLRPT
ncbi:MAG: hypothetical protein GEV06_15070 [Luteitalea sp.]|nr:hypothetical protein [Luteitalea sp.]